MRARALEREAGWDALRGIAILAMVASHLAREMLPHPHPMWLRVFGSLAAPLFITLAGVLTAQTSAVKRYGLRHYIHRGGVILLLAACVDVLIWGVYPFIGWDVLYLIGVAVPLTAIFGRLRRSCQILGVVMVVLLSDVLRATLGYPVDVLTIPLNSSPGELISGWNRVGLQWFISGWFPLFPWIAFSFLGVWLFQWKQHRKSTHLQDGETASSRLTPLAGAILLIAVGLSLNVVYPTPQAERGGYSELFYPPTLAYLAWAAGALLLLFAVSRWPVVIHATPLIELGRCSLLIYVTHLAMLRWLLHPLIGEVELPLFLVVYAALILLLVALARIVALGRPHRPRRLPPVLRLLLGS